MGWKILLIVVFAVVGGVFIYWQLIITEGVYLGQKIVTLLYDRVAHKYNAIKEFDENEERLYLALPLSRTLGYNFHGILLDVATGTARLPIAMSLLPHFQGQIIGLDHSPKMLKIARETMPGLPLVVGDATRLPFAHHAVQAVTCLEALEFFPSPQAGVREFARVLSPGGTLLTTNRIGWEAKLMPGKTWQSEHVKPIFEKIGFANIVIRPWLDIYQQVWARKKM